jgi:tricorn protease-like protein
VARGADLLERPGGTADLWSVRPDGTDRRRHTRHEMGRPLPAMGGRSIVFSLAGEIHVYDRD